MATVVSFGEVLTRFSTLEAQRFQQAKTMEIIYGGSEANVTSALARWKVPAAHATVFPDNEIGEAACQLLQSYGVDTKFCLAGKGRMGIYFLEHGSALRAPKVIYDRYHSAFANLEPQAFDWQKILEGAQWFHWSGITPAVSPAAAEACKQALLVAKAKNITVSADINYRRVLWQYGKTPREVMPELVSMSDILIAGITDIENCLGIRVAAGDDQNFEDVCKQVKVNYPLVKSITTTERVTHDSLRNDLQGLLWKNGELTRSKNYSINFIQDRIGSGDAFMAGFIYKSIQGGKEKDIIDFATASAAYKHTIPGDVLMASVKEIEDCMNQQNVGKLLR